VTLLVRDLIYVMELVDAISCGDFGHIEDILPDLACIFRGAGSNNYSTEILHFLHNIKEVWTPEFACVLQNFSSLSKFAFLRLGSFRNIMRDSMLVNPSGLQGHFMGTDLNIEHLIRYLKVSLLLSSILLLHNYHIQTFGRQFLLRKGCMQIGTDSETSQQL
jgi:hypothetical protein